jgi:hypothetical protein
VSGADLVLESDGQISIRGREWEKVLLKPTGEKFGSEYLSTVFFLRSGFVWARAGFGSDNGGGTIGWPGMGIGVADCEGGTGVEPWITGGVIDGGGKGGVIPGGGNPPGNG